MSLQSYLWRIYSIDDAQYETIVSDTEPTVDSHGGPIDPSQTALLQINFVNLSTDSYINIQSTLADNQAIKIVTGPTGGLMMSTGFGGIDVFTTNSIELNAGAASNFSTTLGNLTLNTTSGLVNMDGLEGINIGNSGTSGPIFIGTTGNNRSVQIGKLGGNSSVNINGGTGGINANTTNGAISLNAGGKSSNFTLVNPIANQDLTLATVGATSSRIVLSAQGTGADSIFFNTSTGGLQASINGAINLVSNSTSGSAIGLSTGSGGGISISSGSQGISVNCPSNSVIAIGTFNSSEYIVIGNNSSSSYIGLRYGTSGFIKTQHAFTALSDSNSTLTASQLLTNLLIITPSVTRTLTLDIASNIVAGVYLPQIDDSFDFTVINQSGATGVIVAQGTNGTLYGSGLVNGTGFGTGSGLFRVRLTNVTGTQSYDLYRLS